MLFLIFLILYIFVGLCFNHVNQRNQKGCPLAPLCDKCYTRDGFTQLVTICFWPIEAVIIIIKLIGKFLSKYANNLVDIIYDCWENLRSDSED